MSDDPFDRLLRRVARGPHIDADEVAALARGARVRASEGEYPWLGETVGEHYRIESALGAGGYAAVYGATDIRDGRLVAIKALHSAALRSASRRYRTATRRFERERRFGARLDHEAIAGVLDAGKHAETEFIVFEHIPGGTLASLVDEVGALEVDRAWRLLRDVLRALGHAHANGIVHRDVKPQNIMVCAEDADASRARAVLLDFGIAAPMQAATEGPALTAAEDVPCSMHYASPEQLRKAPLSGASDLYAWGLVFLECVVGRPIAEGASSHGVMLWHLRDVPVPLPDVFSPELAAAFRPVVARQPAARYPSVEHALAALDAVLG